MTERQKIENRLDMLCSRIVRNRDSNCITCGKRLNDSISTAGHYMKRRHHGTRWDLRNLNAQCVQCNISDDTEAYRKAMENRYGDEITRQIESDARKNIKYSANELKDLYNKLKYEAQNGKNFK
jgi:hypothetical protein